MKMILTFTRYKIQTNQNSVHHHSSNLITSSSTSIHVNFRAVHIESSEDILVKDEISIVRFSCDTVV